MKLIQLMLLAVLRPQYHINPLVTLVQVVAIMWGKCFASLGYCVKLAQRVREELSGADTVLLLVLVSIVERLEGEGETPKRPGRGGRGGREGREGRGGWEEKEGRGGNGGERRGKGWGGVGGGEGRVREGQEVGKEARERRGRECRRKGREWRRKEKGDEEGGKD